MIVAGYEGRSRPGDREVSRQVICLLGIKVALETLDLEIEAEAETGRSELYFLIGQSSSFYISTQFY